MAVRIDDGIMIVGGIFIEYVFVVDSVVCFVFIVHRDVVCCVGGLLSVASFYFGIMMKVQSTESGRGGLIRNYFDPPRHN